MYVCLPSFLPFLSPLSYLPREFIKDKRNPEFTMQQYLYRQRNVLHGYEARSLRNIPKVRKVRSGQVMLYYVMLG